MGKLDSMVKCAQARNLLEEKKYKKAIAIIEKIDLEKVKSIIDLKTIAQIYMESHQFMNAREVYVLIYDKVQSRSVLYHLIYLSIQCGLLDEAERYYEEYKEMDGNSLDCSILSFYMKKANGENQQNLIEAIKEILAHDYLEEWAYELAKLYHKEGMTQECVAECSKIILWFGEGIVVEKAMLLKLHYVDGLDISSPKAIDETRNIAAELKIAAKIADAQENAQYRKELQEHGYMEEENKEVNKEDSKEEKQVEQEAALENPEVKTKQKKMIDNIVEEAIRTKEMPHFSIIGNNEDKIMEITKTLMRDLASNGVLNTPRIAKISAKKVNNINLEEKKEQLEGSCLLIEEANELSLDSLQTLCQIMKRFRLNVLVGFIDGEEEMKQLMNRNRKIQTLIKYELYV